jgi:hypothetical protein
LLKTLNIESYSFRSIETLGNMGKAKKRRSGAGKRTDPVGKNLRLFLKLMGSIFRRGGGGKGQFSV